MIYQQGGVSGSKLEPAAGKLVRLIEPILLGQVFQPGIAGSWIGRVGLDRVLPGSDRILRVALLKRLPCQACLEGRV